MSNEREYLEEIARLKAKIAELEATIAELKAPIPAPDTTPPSFLRPMRKTHDEK